VRHGGPLITTSLVQEYFPEFKAHLAALGTALPAHVEQEFEEYLKCGRLEHGFLRVRCDSCHAEHLVAFSCKKRGFCPSWGARRMAESAALLVDEVSPEQPVRQWGEGRPLVQWTNAACRTTGQDVRAGIPRHGWLLSHAVVSAGDSRAGLKSWVGCWVSSTAASPPT
jgi:hypothetical protein